ncbi:MAG: right-handed parallel beta-helix repeat-containing protein [Acidimicrobiales bacterium]
MSRSSLPPARSIHGRLFALSLALVIAASGFVLPAGGSAGASSAVVADPATGSTVSLPANAIVIHVDQSQAARFFPQTGTWADGSAANPFPNLAQGVWQAQQLRKGGAGVRVVVAPGVYREKVEIGWTSSAPGPLVLEASVPGTVVVTGADVEQRWTRVPGTFLYSAPWTNNWGLAPVPTSWGGITVDDLVRRREGVYVDSQALEQVGTPSELTPGKFLVDEAADQIVMAPPAGVADLGDHVVEVTARDRALRIHGTTRSVAVKGFTFEGAAPGFEKHMVYVSDSTDVLIENNLFRHSTWGGLGLASASSVTVRNNRATGNGGNGIDTYKSHNVVIEGNRIEGSNLRGVVNGYVGWSTAGSKNLLLHGAVFRRNTYEGNFARGLWFDTDVKDVLVDGDRSCGNLSDGVFIEAVQGPLTIRGATFCGNNGAGIRVGTSGGVRVEASTVANNRYGLLFAGERHRSWYDHVTGVLVEMGDFADWTLLGNVFVSPGTPPLISSSVIPMTDWKRLLAAGEIVASRNTFTRTPLDGTIQIQGKTYSLTEWDRATGDTRPVTTTTTAPLAKRSKVGGRR